MKSEIQKVNSYTNINIRTASPLKLVILLYDAAIRNIEEAINNIDDFRKFDLVNENLQKSNEIIAELKTSLNMKEGGEISKNLNDIYNYLSEKIVQGNIEKKSSMLQEVVQHLKEMKSSWEAISKANSYNDKKVSTRFGKLDIKS